MGNSLTLPDVDAIKAIENKSNQNKSNRSVWKRVFAHFLNDYNVATAFVNLLISADGARTARPH